jgi:hypothetical protein
MATCIDRCRYDGKERIGAFNDDDFPDDFGWTALAFEPMTREEGQRYFGDLRLA